MMEEINEFDFENRIISNEYNSTEDSEVENCLRPKTLSEYVGQEKAKSNLKVYIESAKMHKMEAEKEIADVKQQFINQFKLINDLCIKNNTYPFFKDPTNLVECEKTRLDLVRIIPEKIINEFFSVENFGDYYPPKYNKD